MKPERPILEGITHGGFGAAGYNKGCRCPECTAANAARQKRKRLNHPDLARRQREAAKRWLDAKTPEERRRFFREVSARARAKKRAAREASS